jgi:Tfp pilus assembly protein PilO
MVLTLLLLCPLWNPVRGEEGGSAGVQALKEQLQTVNRQLDDAQRQLSAIPGPNYCCCAGAFILAPVVGGIFWYFVDIKPKQDKRHQLESRIQTLTSERQSLITQIAILDK